jgi:hypothetical protein
MGAGAEKMPPFSSSQAFDLSGAGDIWAQICEMLVLLASPSILPAAAVLLCRFQPRRLLYFVHMIWHAKSSRNFFKKKSTRCQAMIFFKLRAFSKNKFMDHNLVILLLKLTYLD